MAGKNQEGDYIYTRSQREAREHGSDMTRYMTKIQGKGYGSGFMPFDEGAADGGGGPQVWYRYPSTPGNNPSGSESA